MDVRIEFLRTARTGDALIAQVVENRADLALGQLADSLEWAKSVRFSTPYLTLYQTSLFDRLRVARAGGPEALLDQPDARLAVRANSVALPLLREELGAERLVTFPTIEAALAEAQAGRIVGIAGDDVEMSRWLAEHADAGIRWEIQLRRDRPLTIAMAVGWNAENLQAWLNLYLGKAARDQTLAKLWVKHLGEARMRTEK
jgi:ABC-type amino acid transport substrate-binding protein